MVGPTRFGEGALGGGQHVGAISCIDVCWPSCLVLHGVPLGQSSKDQQGRPWRPIVRPHHLKFLNTDLLISPGW